jgi:DNA-directed RNA polymerase sigma subunit (sigma70/sigma32)
LVVELSAAFRISPTTVDMAKEYLSEDVSLNASVNDSIDKIERLIDVDKDVAYKYLFSATEELVIAHIRNLKSTRVINMTPKELREGRL